MCIVIYALDAHPKYRLILATNRDEFLARPTSPATWLDTSLSPSTPDQQWDVLSGKDDVGGGLWFGLNRKGQLGVLTNFTEPPITPAPASTRGSLLADFLTASPPSSPSSYLASLSSSAHSYAGFNLLLFSLFPPPPTSAAEAWYLSNRTPCPSPSPHALLSSGVGGMSNSLLEDPWEKVTACKSTLGHLLAQEDDGGWGEDRWLDELDEMMSPSIAPDRSLPFPLSLSPTIPPFVFPSPTSSTTPRWYGTRLLTMLLVTHSGEFVCVERDVWELGEENGKPIKGRRENERRFEGRLDRQEVA